MQNTLKKYFIKTIKHYRSLDDKVLFSDIQLCPFLFWREFDDKCLKNIADSYFQNFPLVIKPRFSSAGYLQQNNDWKQCNLIHPFDFAFLESLGFAVFENYHQKRNANVEVYFAGAPNNTLFGSQYDFAKYTESVAAHKSKFSHYISVDVASFSKSVDIAQLVNKVREGCKNNSIFNEEFYLTLYSTLTNFGDGFLPQFKTHSACRFVSSVVAFDNIDAKFYAQLQNEKTLKDFKLIRNGDEILILFNPQNAEIYEECKNKILQTYTNILQEEGLKANVNKTHYGKTQELEQAVYSDSLITKVALKGNDAISGNHKAPKIAMISFLQKMQASGMWSRRWTNIALRLLVIDNADKFTNEKQRKFLERIIKQKHQNTLFYINNFCKDQLDVDKTETSGAEPLCTLIVRTYNSDRTLKKCLQVACSQANKNFEILIADDGSTDQSIKIAQAYERGYDNVHLQPMSHCGKVKAREIAVKFASGKYISFCDGDDFIAHDFWQKISNVLCKNNDATNQDSQTPQLIVYGYKKHYASSSENILPESEGVINIKQNAHELEKFAVSNFELGSCMCVFERELLQNSLHKNYEMNMFEDFAFTYPCLFQAKNPYFINGVLYHYNKTNEASSTNVKNATFEDLITCAQYYLSLIENDGVAQNYRSTILNLILNWIAIELKRLWENDKDAIEKIDVKKLSDTLSQFSQYAETEKLTHRNKKLLQILINGKLKQAIKFLNFDKKIYEFINKDSSEKNLKKNTRNESASEKFTKPKQNLISIIIPTLNCENSIEKTLDSVVNQDADFAYEIIIVDNNSTDNTRKIAEEKLANFARAQIHNIKEHNVNIARKLGMQKANGSYILFVDADDDLCENAIAKLSETINAHPNINIIAFDYIRHQEGWTKTYENNYKEGLYNSSEIKASICQNIIHNFNDTLWSYCYKKSFIQRFYTKDNSMKRGEDTATIFNCLSHANSLYNLHKPLYLYNCANNFESIKQNELDKVIDDIKKNCGHIDNLDYQLKQLKNSFQVARDE